MRPSVYQMIELVGTSEKSWEEAAKTAVENAAKQYKDMRIAEVVSLDLKVLNNQVVAYRARVKVSFKVDD
jgi:flavin-binding protein dodecin